jgi:leucyl aminopeptidase (aminopeptidase T)
MAFSFCQVPVVYQAAEKENITITFADGQQESLAGNSLNEQYSRQIFERTGKITRIDVNVVL